MQKVESFVVDYTAKKEEPVFDYGEVADYPTDLYHFDAVSDGRLNCVVDWQTAAWDGMIAAVEGGQFDVGIGIIALSSKPPRPISSLAHHLMPIQIIQNSALVSKSTKHCGMPRAILSATLP